MRETAPNPHPSPTHTLQPPWACAPGSVALGDSVPAGSCVALAQLTLPLSTISFCRLVEVITRSRMAYKPRHVALGTAPPWIAVEPAPVPGPGPLTFIRSVQELRILRNNGRTEWQV